MTVTQYVGARYVPLFADPIDWDNTKEYEPLTIVYYAGNSYTSRQAVPKNIEITNEDFWALTGNYNAQIEQYRREVYTFDERISKNASDIKKANICFQTVLEMQNSKDLSEGMTVKTNGFYEPNDSGGAFYVIERNKEANGIDAIDCGEFTASIIVPGKVTIEMLGAKQKKDVSEIVNFAIKKYKHVVVCKKDYMLSAPINMQAYSSLEGLAELHVGSKDSTPTFTWNGQYDNAAISTITDEAQYKYYDTYPHYGMTVKNISVKGNDNLKMGFLLSGQQTCFFDKLYATGCTCGIVITRSWNFSIGTIAAFHCDLGISTVPVDSLTTEGNVNTFDYVDDTAFNNVTVGNVTAQDCGSGIYLNVGLSPIFNCIDVERCSNIHGFGIRIISMSAFFPAVHIERLKTLPTSAPDIKVTNVFAKRVPAFGSVSASVIETDVPMSIDTLISYNPGNRVKYNGNIRMRPLVKTYSDTSNSSEFLHDEIFKPSIPISSIVGNNSVTIPSDGEYIYVMVSNLGNDASEVEGKININGSGGYPKQTISIPSLAKNECRMYRIRNSYLSTLPGQTMISVSNLLNAPDYRFIIYGGFAFN